MTIELIGIRKMVRSLENYQIDFLAKINKLLKRLGEAGKNIVAVEFSTAIYNHIGGTEPPKLSYRITGDTLTIYAEKEGIVFIEFGAGISYPDIHPVPHPGRGTYGKGHGNQKTWGYYGTEGGFAVIETKNGEVHLTHGTPANMKMYRASKYIEGEIVNLCKEVFEND